MTSILDGYSRYLVHWEIREKMEEVDVEAIVQRAREKFPGENPRIITDNGPQFISKDFKQFVRICGMTHVDKLHGREQEIYAERDRKSLASHKQPRNNDLRTTRPGRDAIQSLNICCHRIVASQSR